MYGVYSKCFHNRKRQGDNKHDNSIAMKYHSKPKQENIKTEQNNVFV